jgi:hypothetical protein
MLHKSPIKIGSMWQHQGGAHWGAVSVVTFIGTVNGRTQVGFTAESVLLFNAEDIEKFFTKVR